MLNIQKIQEKREKVKKKNEINKMSSIFNPTVSMIMFLIHGLPAPIERLKLPKLINAANKKHASNNRDTVIFKVKGWKEYNM